MSIYESRESRSSEQINREFDVRGRPQNGLPRTIIEIENEVNFTESNIVDWQQNSEIRQQLLAQSLQGFQLETDTRTQWQSNNTSIDTVYDDSIDRHIFSLTGSMESNSIIADPLVSIRPQDIFCGAKICAKSTIVPI